MDNIERSCLECTNRTMWGCGPAFTEANSILRVGKCHSCGCVRPLVVRRRKPLASRLWSLTHPHGFQGGKWVRQ